MTDDTDNVTEFPNASQNNKKQTSKSILDQVTADINKEQAQQLKAKFKDLVAKRTQLVKSLATVDAEIKELSKKFDNGEL